MDIGDVPGYRLAITAKYDDHYAALSVETAHARRAALQPFLDRVLAALDLPDEGAHLDLGCGDGLCAIAVALLRPRVAVLGLDASPKALALARKVAAAEGARNATFLEGDVEAPPDAAFDRLSALSVFNLLPDKAAALAAWRKIAIPQSGRLVIADGLATAGPGTLGAGALSPDGLDLAARRAGWRVVHREDLTPLVAKLTAAGVWPWPEYVRPGVRYAVVALQPR